MSSLVTNRFHCSDCGKEFSKEKKLISHFKVHSTKKSYKCEVCKLTFPQKSFYKKHIRLHFEKGTCSCPKCGKVFVRHSWLKRHLNLQCNDPHQNTKFVCRNCGKMYDSLAGVRSHLRKGKHMVPDFMCFSCKWICSSSEVLFFHVLQHEDVNLVIVGIDKEQQLECFSTSKIREKVDTANFKTDSSTCEDSKEIDKALSESILDAGELENLAQSTETIVPQNIMQSSKVSSLDETSLEGDITQSQSETLKDICTNGKPNDASPTCENDAKVLMPFQENKVTFDLVSPIDSLEAILPQEGASSECVRQNNNSFTAENYACTVQPSQENFMINKKMPKLLNLYPEEEHSGEDNSCAVRANNIMLGNEISMPHNMMCSELQADPVTSRPNEIISYTTPLVNTMFLPPLFLIRNTLPMNPSIPHQNTFLMGERIIDNHIMQDNTSATTIMDELQNMTDEITVPRKKKKRLSRLGKKYPEIFQLGKNVTTNYIKPHNQKVNSSQLPVQNFATINNNVIISQSANSVLTDHTLVLQQENRIQRLEDLVNLTEQMNATNTDIIRKENSNQYQTQNLQGKNKSSNVFWEILIGNEDSDGKIVSSISAGLRNQSNIRNKGQKSTSSEFFLNNATPENEEGNLKATCDTPTLGCQQQQHRSKEGIAVEDYIKKFMWL